MREIQEPCLGCGGNWTHSDGIRIVSYNSIKWEVCDKCLLYETTYKHVLYRGTATPKILFIGEGPGKSEDVQGLPFVGPSGKLLDESIRVATNFADPCWGFTNLVACRPCDGIGAPNRIPSQNEILACSQRLISLIASNSRLRLIIAVGRIAQNYLPKILPPELGLEIKGIMHPAALLRKGGRESPEYPEYVEAIRQIWKEANIENPKEKRNS